MQRILALLVVLGLVGIGSSTEISARERTRPAPPTRVVLPGEFEPVERLIMAWDDSLAEFLVDVMAAAWGEAPITVLLGPDQPDDGLVYSLRQVGLDPRAIQRLRAPVGSVWVRDFGPLVVRAPGGRRQVVDFAYYLDEQEDRLPRALARKLWPRWPVHHSFLDLEGGNIQSDGHGRCITTAGYLDVDLLPMDTVDHTSLRQELRAKLGCQTLAIVPPLDREPTGHVDMFATITAPGEVIVGRYDPMLDPENAHRLERAADTLRGAGFRVRRIPMPDHGDGLFRSYTNALAVNGAVIVPVYPEAAGAEEEALAVFRAAYPGRRIVPVVATDIIGLYGAVHCATMTIATQGPGASRAGARIPGTRRRDRPHRRSQRPRR